MYANLRGLSKTYVDKGILPNTAAFFEFVLGFNKAHPLCDFIDAGNHKEAADTKLKGDLSETTIFNALWLTLHGRKSQPLCLQCPLQTDHLRRVSG